MFLDCGGQSLFSQSSIDSAGLERVTGRRGDFSQPCCRSLAQFALVLPGDPSQSSIYLALVTLFELYNVEREGSSLGLTEP